MNAQLTANTIKRIEALGFTVGDSGGTTRPYVLRESPTGETMSGALNADELYKVAQVLDFVVRTGGIVEHTS